MFYTVLTFTKDTVALLTYLHKIHHFPMRYQAQSWTISKSVLHVFVLWEVARVAELNQTQENIV